MNGHLDAILIAAEAGIDLMLVPSAELEIGKGIVGDRYHTSQGTFSKSSDTEVTLIEWEEIEAFNQVTGLDYESAKFRRNLVTVGVRLNERVGREFSIGDVLLRGMRLCEPCGYLAKLIGKDVMQHMKNKAGLRAQILQGGTISVNDAIQI
ncbi:MAG: MOSC domain-containing protein [Cyanobacteria bacterium P01_E01_bin.34]